MKLDVDILPMKPLKFYILNAYLETLPVTDQTTFLKTLPPILKSRMFGEDDGYDDGEDGGYDICAGCERIWYFESYEKQYYVCELCDYGIGFKCYDCLGECYRHTCNSCLKIR